MQWKKIRLWAAAAALLFAGGCDAAVGTNLSGEPSAGADGAAAPAEATEMIATESASAAADDDIVGSLPSADLAETTVSVTGTIAELDPQAHYVIIAESGDPQDMASAVQAQITDRTLIIDSISGTTLAESALAAGERISADVSPRMTRSIPPQAEAFALFADVPESGPGAAHYVRAMDVMTAEDGGTVVLNQNADLYITIPPSLSIGRLDSPETAPASDITEGSVLIVWYGAVAESYPAQTTAERVILAG